MKAFLIVRYSVVSRNIAQTWEAGRDVSFEDYVRSILDPERLSLREILFENLVLYSILNQTRKVDSSWFKLIILTSDGLPQRNRQNLEAMVSPYDWVDIVYSPIEGGGRNTNQILRDSLRNWSRDKPFPFVTMRLDDDDALSADFLDRLSDHCLIENEGTVISFGEGFCGIFSPEKRTFVDFARLHHPKASMGMSIVSVYDPSADSITSQIKNIYEAGNHMKVDENHRLISENVTPSFLRSIYPSQDSAISSARQFKDGNRTDASEVRKYIPFIG